MKSLVQLSVVSACLLTLAIPAGAREVWQTDLPAACRQAEKENKLVLMDFTGSDWCSACVRLRHRVLDAPAFREFADSRFVLVEVDIPLNAVKAPELRQRNEEIAQRYGVAGFPTLMVINPQGEVMGGFQNGDVSVVEARALLESACEAAALFNQAAAQQGEERARTLFRIYHNFPDSKSFAVSREKLMQSILEADTGDVTGMRGIMAAKEQACQFLAQRAAVPHASPELGKLLEQQLTAAMPANRTEVMMARCQYAMSVAESVEDIQKTRRMFEDLLPHLPEAESAELQQYLHTYFREPTELLRMLRMNRTR
jgi:thioredoxin-related protein